MANTEMLTALNEQIKHEYFSSYLYLSMSAYFADMGLSGFAHWMRMQAEEEMLHVNKMYDYVIARGGKIKLYAIDEPQAEWNSPLDVFNFGLDHERYVTGRINSLMDLALKTKDHAAHSFLQWFVNEQVEEEESFTDIINTLKLVQGDGRGLLLVDRELIARAAPSIASATTA
ncbi:ferritin [Desulfovibrio cuneatus]|uniref:ferritin n=1 Tax=Desulfovibrio cuneatus TaxID=159728 RepID=UPI00040DB74C|nr:ferritin [Desulfovibrio cuneatus]